MVNGDDNDYEDDGTAFTGHYSNFVSTIPK